MADEKQITLTNKELLLLYQIKKGTKVLASSLTHLAHEGLVEKIGHGKWALSRQYYRDMKDKTVYTKRKVISKERLKVLILEHLSNYPEGATSKEFQNLLDLYPMATWRLLNDLRKEGKITFSEDKGTKGIWQIVM